MCVCTRACVHVCGGGVYAHSCVCVYAHPCVCVHVCVRVCVRERKRECVRERERERERERHTHTHTELLTNKQYIHVLYQSDHILMFLSSLSLAGALDDFPVNSGFSAPLHLP